MGGGNKSKKLSSVVASQEFKAEAEDAVANKVEAEIVSKIILKEQKRKHAEKYK